ncbi:MAG: LysR family transcriptional regulator [Spirochaetia bacterium]
MERDQVEAFVAVARAHGFSNAGAILHLSQPAVSRRIRLLEQELGVPLFERVHGGALLSPAGKAFEAHAHRILAAVRDAREAVRSIEKQSGGAVTLAMVGSLAGTALTARLVQFRKRHPDIHLLLRTARSTEISTMVRTGEAQVGLRYFPDSDPELVSRVIDQEQLVVVCSPQRDFGKRTRIRPADLRGTPWVTFPLGSSGEPFAQLLARQLQTADLAPPELIVIDSLTSQKRLIEADFGVGLLPVSGIQEELSIGTLRVLAIPELRAAAPVVLLSKRRGLVSEAARTLLSILAATPVN